VFTRLSFLRLAGALALILLRPAVAQVSQPAADSSADQTQSSTHIEQRPAVLGRGDTVALQVYGQPDLAASISVGQDGTIPVSLAGPVQVAGLSPANAAKRVEAALRDGKFLNDPHVSIIVTQSASRNVSVLGEVAHPGRYPIDAQTKLADLLAQAGGTKDTGADVIYLVRSGREGAADRYAINLKGLEDPTKANPAQSLALQPGDQVFVPKAPMFTIYGEVKTPARYRLEDNMTIEEAIALAGGIKETGSTRRIDVQRRDSSQKLQKIKVKLNDPVKPDDVIHVKESIF
jgi:polysaccharide export outer membrane protein